MHLNEVIIIQPLAFTDEETWSHCESQGTWNPDLFPALFITSWVGKS